MLKRIDDQKRLNDCSLTGINVAMRLRLLRIAMISVMALLWMAQAGHCSLRIIPGLDFLDCTGAQTSASSSEVCCAGECKSVESRQQRTETRKPLASPKSEVMLCLKGDLAAKALLPSENHRFKTFADIPPEFPKRWQFIERTALPPRAPSVAS
jgi:hypothetical protein